MQIFTFILFLDLAELAEKAELAEPPWPGPIDPALSGSPRLGSRVVPGSGRPVGRVGLGRVRNIDKNGGPGRVQTLAGRVGSKYPDPT